LVSGLGLAVLYVQAALPYIILSRARGFYYVLNVSIILFLMSITKMAFHDPRPYMLDDDI